MACSTNEKDYVSLVRVSSKWFYIFVLSFSIITILNLLIELLTDWAWKELGNTLLTRMSVLMTLIVGWFFILSHAWEVTMIGLGYAKRFKQKIFDEGKAEGKAEAYQEIYEAWEKRKQDAEARGETFNEPLPIPDYEKPLDPLSLNSPMP